MANVKTVPERLRDAAKLFEERNKAYGGNYKNFGSVMSAMYPHGLEIRTAEEWTRLILQVHRVTKETRYATNFARGGHGDSLDDMAVYAIMAAETDELAREDKPEAAQEAKPSGFKYEIGQHVKHAGLDWLVVNHYYNHSGHPKYHLCMVNTDNPPQYMFSVDESLIMSIHEDPPEADIPDEWRGVGPARK